MMYLSALKPRSGAGGSSRSSAPLMAQVPVSRAAAARRQLLPAQPSAIPVLPLRPELKVGSAVGPLEREANAMAAHAAGGRPGCASGMGSRSVAGQSQLEPMEAPPLVHEALASPGHALDSSTRATMEERLGGDLGGVRLHTGARAAEAAQAVQAKAYTIGQDVFFGAGRYDPRSREGKRLLAHELSHTLQQSGRGGRQGLSKAGLSVQRDPLRHDSAKATAQGTSVDNDTKKPQTGQVTVPVPPSVLSRYQLTPPSLLTPPQTPSYFSPGTYTLGGGGAGSTPGQTPSLGHPGASLFQQPPQSMSSAPPGPVIQPSPYLTPPAQGSGSAGPTASPKAPDRISLHDFGSLSIGARIGFPDLTKDTKPGDPPSALQETMKKGEILNFMFTGQPPAEYSIDPGKLVGVLWGIFSTQIDPSLAAKIAAGMASKPTGHGLTYQLDTTILFSSSGGKTGGGAGATLTVNF